MENNDEDKKIVEFKPEKRIILGKSFTKKIEDMIKVQTQNFNRLVELMNIDNEEIVVKDYTPMIKDLSFYDVGPMLSADELVSYVDTLCETIKMLENYKKQLLAFIFKLMTDNFEKEKRMILTKCVLIFKYPYCFCLKFGMNSIIINHVISLDNNNLINLDNKTKITYDDIYYEKAIQAIPQLRKNVIISNITNITNAITESDKIDKKDIMEKLNKIEKNKKEIIVLQKEIDEKFTNILDFEYIDENQQKDIEDKIAKLYMGQKKDNNKNNDDYINQLKNKFNRDKK